MPVPPADPAPQPRTRLVLATGSESRRAMVAAAGLTADLAPARIDEEAVRQALAAEGASPRDQADALAEMKARKISDRVPGALVLGADQILDLDGQVFAKPETAEAARAQLARLSGKTHRLHSAAVVYRDGEPLWRHVGTARLTLNTLSERFIDGYVFRNWDDIRHTVGGYMIEKEGVRLMARIEGDHFTILGLPLLPLLNWLRVTGEIDG
ncbi:Maf family protein [Frigidibacter sp. MR17.24]|uniref:Maf family protein n=1 Tax=Frigidibacter sp. MR17.24 TaxID=3127345 RepID=UPI00301302C4